MRVAPDAVMRRGLFLVAGCLALFAAHADAAIPSGHAACPLISDYPLCGGESWTALPRCTHAPSAAPTLAPVPTKQPTLPTGVPTETPSAAPTKGTPPRSDLLPRKEALACSFHATHPTLPLRSTSSHDNCAHAGANSDSECSAHAGTDGSPDGCAKYSTIALSDSSSDAASKCRADCVADSSSDAGAYCYTVRGADEPNVGTLLADNGSLGSEQRAYELNVGALVTDNGALRAEQRAYESNVGVRLADSSSLGSEQRSYEPNVGALVTDNGSLGSEQRAYESNVGALLTDRSSLGSEQRSYEPNFGTLLADSVADAGTNQDSDDCEPDLPLLPNESANHDDTDDESPRSCTH